MSSLPYSTVYDHRRFWSLITLSLGALMISLDASIVNVAVPAIQSGLGFSDTSLTWIVNAYCIPFGGFLLLGGRLGDLFGHRRLFLLGIGLFTAASLGCGLASSQALLIGGRVLQGVGGAFAAGVALSLTLVLFPQPLERAKAMSVFSFIGIGGGGIALLLGGTLTSALSWHWIFLVNVPLGIAVYVLGQRLLPEDHVQRAGQRFDLLGSLTVILSLLTAQYAVLGRQDTHGGPPQTLGLLIIATALLAVFLVVEARVANPLVPLKLFRKGNLSAIASIAALASAALYTWYFTLTLYLQLVLGYTPFQVGAAFLIANQMEALFTLGLSVRLIARIGLKHTLSIGMLLAAVGLGLFALAPANGSFIRDVLPGTILVGMGLGTAWPPLLLMAAERSTDSGLVIGIINTVSIMGGTLGLTILTDAAATHTDTLLLSGLNMLAARNDGYHIAFFVGSFLIAVAGAIGAVFLQATSPRSESESAA